MKKRRGNAKQLLGEVQSPKTFLLYIDVLAFRNMVQHDRRKVARLYAILDSLNVHRHGAFKTIVFSDTVLVYNHAQALNDEDRKYYVWYLEEFAEDLHHRLTGQDIYFRAVLTAGDFFHYSLDHIECFFGDALVSAYLKEKSIPAVGLFIDRAAARYNQFFRITNFDSNLAFVYLNRSLESIHEFSGDVYPLDYPGPISDQAPYAAWQVIFLRDIYDLMRAHGDPTVRVKFLTTWDFYRQRYPGMLAALERSTFSLESLTSAASWGNQRSVMERDIKYFKRIGSGTDLSRAVATSRRDRS